MDETTMVNSEVLEAIDNIIDTSGDKKERDESSKTEESLPPMSVPPSLSKIFWMAKPEIPMLIVALILAIFAESCNLVIPLIIANAYNALVDEDSSMSDNPMADINYFMGLALALYAAGMASQFARASILGVIGERLVARLRYKLYNSILHQEIAFFDSHKSGELVSRLGSDTTLLQDVISQAIPDSFIGIMNVIVSIAFMFYISPKLAGLTLGGTAILCTLTVPFGLLLSKLSKEYQDILGDAQTNSTEALGNMRTVQAFAAEDKELSRFGKKIGNPDDFKWWWPAKDAGRSTYRVGVFKSLTQSSFYTTIFGGGFGFLYVNLWFGFYLVTEGEISLGDLTAFQSYIFSIGFGLGQAAGNFARVFEGLGASGRIFYLLERVPEIEKGTTAPQGENRSGMKREEGSHHPPSHGANNQTPLVPSTMDGSIYFDNVMFSYPSRPDVLILNGFTLDLRQNTTTALVGSSGAGKSTVVSLIQRFYDIEGGQITIDGNNIQDLDLTWLRRQIGYVQQEPQLFGLTIRENLLYGVEDESSVSQAEIESVCRDANAHDFISAWSTGYNTLVGEKGVKLSGGQKQSMFPGMNFCCHNTNEKR
jgi:ABC-type multidrug transport system fused ATPase/permease subunit